MDRPPPKTATLQERSEDSEVTLAEVYAAMRNQHGYRGVNHPENPD